MRTLIILLVLMIGCGPIEKTPQPLFKFIYLNGSPYDIQIRVTGLGDPNWLTTPPDQPSPPPNPTQIKANSWVVFCWKVPPKQIFLDAPAQPGDVLALGRDYGADGFSITCK